VPEPSSSSADPPPPPSLSLSLSDHLFGEYEVREGRLHVDPETEAQWDEELAAEVMSTGAEGPSPCPNQASVMELIEMAKVCECGCDECHPKNDMYRAKALKLAALKIKGEKQRVSTKAQVDALMAQVLQARDCDTYTV
jgi:hypothetical protein